MAMTIVEKILARAGGVPNVSPGDFVVVNVDTDHTALLSHQLGGHVANFPGAGA